jgi:cell division protease FtsH
MIAGLCVFLFWYLRGGQLFGSVKKYKQSVSDISFSDIGGIDEVKDSLIEAVGFLKDREYLEKLGARIPKGILLVGSPGVGKTMLAKAMAKEANVPFYYTSGSDFNSVWVSFAGQKVKSLFREAGKQPSVIFIDEIDSIAQRRGTSDDAVGKEFNHTLNQLLAEMDGFKKNNKVLVIAATNRVEVLDEAILRPGRFDRKIIVPLPNYKERNEILTIHSKDKPLSGDVSLDIIAKQTSGLSGAELANIINESAIFAGRLHKDKIEMSDINNAIDKILVGEKRKSLVLAKDDSKIIAYHESGHAIIALSLLGKDAVQRITIIPHGEAGGFTFIPEDMQIFFSKQRIMNRISVLLAGRCAESIIFNELTTSSKEDIKQANYLAREMVIHYGMGDKVGLQYIDEYKKDEMYDSEIRSILNKCLELSQNILVEKRVLLDKLANKLLEVESLNANEINDLIRG